MVQALETPVLRQKRHSARAAQVLQYRSAKGGIMLMQHNTQQHSVRDLKSVRNLIRTAGFTCAVEHFDHHDVLFAQGDRAGHVMFVEAGRVGLTVVAPSGREALCGVQGAGGFIGEAVLAGRQERPCTATALASTCVLVIRADDMVTLLNTEREFAERFVAHSVTHAMQLAADLANQLLYSSEARLVRVLLTLAGCDPDDAVSRPLPDVTQEFIARMVGTTRSRVNMFLGRFKKAGFVEVHDGVLQINPWMLPEVSDGAVPEPGTWS